MTGRVLLPYTQGVMDGSVVIRVVVTELIGGGLTDPVIQPHGRTSGVGVVLVEGFQQGRGVLQVTCWIPAIVGVATFPRYLVLQLLRPTEEL